MTPLSHDRTWMLGAVFAVAMMASARATAQAPDPAGCKLPSSLKPAELIADCDAALSTARDPIDRAGKLYARAYGKNDLDKYEDALADLIEADILSPNNPTYRHELGYTRNALGDYAGALKDLDAELALKPDSVNGYQERYLSHFYLGHFEAAYADADQEARRKPGDQGVLFRRARTALWLERYDLVKADLAMIAATADEKGRKSVDAFAKTLDAWQATSPGASPAANCVQKNNVPQSKPRLIGDCTRAFFDSKTNAKRADALTVRATAWRLLGEENSADTDLAIAEALDPDNPDRHANVGFADLSSHHSWAAEREFDKALARKPDSDIYLAGRAWAKMNLHDEAGAFADAKKSFEIKPDVFALMVLGDLADQRHDAKSAKLYWMGAYELGMRDDDLIASLKSVGVTDPEAELRAMRKAETSTNPDGRQ